MTTFLLTWNPGKWPWDEGERQSAVQATAAGHGFPDFWSIGGRTSGIGPGDRVFLLRQGEEPRGLVASGVVTSDPYRARHWDETPGKLANYVDVDWDRVLDDASSIPTVELMREVPGTHWNTQSSGILIQPPDDAVVEHLWSSAVPAIAGTASGSSAQGWQNDPIWRRAAEDFAQLILMQHFRRQGWEVVDRRFGSPFDALATRGGERRFLEAKGTQSSGQGVLVTPGEVAFARAHPGECVMGIVSEISFRSDGTIDEKSYALRLLEWNPALGELMPTGYKWRPPAPGD